MDKESLKKEIEQDLADYLPKSEEALPKYRKPLTTEDLRNILKKAKLYNNPVPETKKI